MNMQRGVAEHKPPGANKTLFTRTDCSEESIMLQMDVSRNRRRTLDGRFLDNPLKASRASTYTGYTLETFRRL